MTGISESDRACDIRPDIEDTDLSERPNLLLNWRFNRGSEMVLRFTLRQLEYLVAVGEYGSVTEAAERVNVSAPSVSAAISQLEREFGMRMGFRSPRPDAASSIRHGRFSPRPAS